jgi:glycerol-3-phosphate acyltransferase PlsY
VVGQALVLLLAYGLGALPFGVWVARAAGGADPRLHGSGSSGATNVLRLQGPGAALLVALLDGAKGWLAVALVPRLADGVGPWLAVAAAFAAVLALTRRVSPASLVAAATLPASLWAFAPAYRPLAGPLLGTGLLLVLLATHRGNLRRLARGEEPTVGR